MSRSPPKRRRGKQRESVAPGDEVRVHPVEGGSVLGVVKSVLTVHDCVNVCVNVGPDRQLVTNRERVEPVTGVDAVQAQQNVERGDSD